MSQQNQGTSLEAAKRVCPIIAGALILGVVITGGFILPDVLAEAPTGDQSDVSFAAGFAGVCFIAAMIVPNLMAKVVLANNSIKEEYRYPGAYQTRMVVRLAILEAAAFRNIFGVNSDNYPFTLGIVFVLLLTMIAFFPTSGRIDDWIKKKKELAGFPQQDAEFN
ncbi:MAG: hypothetical protein JKY95_00915 [Planctomycetaceae bacterium]|nr:hypothetical protein [Planctomycetaceae bacterium]